MNTRTDRAERERMRRRQIRRRKRRVQLGVRLGFVILVVTLCVLLGIKIYEKVSAVFSHEEYVERTGEDIDASRPDIDVQLLTPNAYSRPGDATKKINGIVIHYTANPGTSAMQNRNYFEGLKDSHQTQASSHFIVGLEGEIVQCIPTKEIAYASNRRNSDTISIETCHETSDGSYSEATYQSMVELTAWLCKKFNLTEDDVIRHYDITEKNCPKYFVEHEDAWKTFKKDVGKALDNR